MPHANLAGGDNPLGFIYRLPNARPQKKKQMRLSYQCYERNSLKGAPLQHFVGKWRIDYLAFSLPENAHKPPLVVLGGAFQNFNSYKFCVERIQTDFPVILVDLPSLGNNDQVAAELSMEDLADLLHEFVVQLDLARVSVMGLSLGSVVASTFAYKHPQLTEKMIVAGIVPRPRKAWRMLMEESRRALDARRWDEFSQAIVLHLVNYGRLEETGLTSTARRLFQRQMAALTENERERYMINGRRLTEVEGILGYPKCEMLVTTGRYDSFTLPHENGGFAAKCPNATFVLIDDADHLPQLERREESLELFSAFLRGVPLETLKGITVVPKAEIAKLERRTHARVIPCNTTARLTSESMIGDAFRFDRPARIIDISFVGCCLQVQSPHSLAEHARDLTLHLSSPEFSFDVLVFEYNEEGVIRCIFKHADIPKTERWLQTLKDPAFFIRKPASAPEKSAIRRIY